MDFETVKLRLKTLGLKHVVLFVLLVFALLDLAIPAVSAWWGWGWGGWWRPWWGWGWGGWWRPWWGWGGWWW